MPITASHSCALRNFVQFTPAIVSQVKIRRGQCLGPALGDRNGSPLPRNITWTSIVRHHPSATLRIGNGCWTQRHHEQSCEPPHDPPGSAPPHAETGCTTLPDDIWRITAEQHLNKNDTETKR